jgi:TP901 family phage tail tape measure protein
MADNLITTNITAHADFTSLRAQLAGITAQLLKLQETTVGTNARLGQQIAVMNKQFAETLRSTGQYATHFVTLNSDVEKFGKNLDSGRLKLNQYFRVWRDNTKSSGGLIKDLARQQVMLENAVVQPLGKNAQGLMQYQVHVAKGLDSIKHKTALARHEASIMNKVMLDGSNQLINWGKNTQWAGRQLTVGLTVPLAAFGMAAQRAFLDANTEVVRLIKVYGGLSQTSKAELAQVQKDVEATAKAMASSYGVAYKDTIALAADMAATGKQGNDLIQATEQTTRLAVLGEVDRQQAMKATLAIQNAFRQNTDELTQSIDFLNAVENQTSTSLEDLTEAIPKAGPVIQAMGGSIQDLALYMTAMKEGGIDASSGANALKSALASLVNPTGVAVDMFKGFGIDLKGIVSKNAGDLTATIMGLQSALDSLDPLQKQQALEQLFGKFQFARMNALFANLGKQGSQTLQVLDLMKASSADLAAVSSRELSMITESASGKYKRALASVQADLAQIGNQFLTISTYVLNVISGIVKFFNQLPDPIQKMLGFLGGLTAIAGPLIMLTGVLGNFVGYVIKGVFHLKSLLKGGQGFKLLTPEIIAAMEAGKGLQAEFYSDAEATKVLTSAVNTLAQSFTNLEVKANAARVSMNPAITTVANGVILPGQAHIGGASARVVDPNNPLVGSPYSRQMAHLTPAGTPQQGSIFGVVPNPGPVNLRIGKNPQAYMDGDLPKIPGLTSIGGVSTGIVAAEAAKWHAMTAAIAMQSEAEIKVLKAEVMSTGTVTSSLSDSYQALLPQFSKITKTAAAEVAQIVEQVKASKITVEQARARIITLNAQVEAMLVSTTAQVAAGMGRTASLSTVPLTGQPAVTATGRSNMKELFHKGPTATMVDRIARALGGVRTSGAGYSIHTTVPRFNDGGLVESFGSNKTQVSGPASINYDDRLGSVPVGGYVLNQEASMDPRNRPLVEAASSTYQGGGEITAMLTPKETVFGAGIQRNPELLKAVDAANNGTPLTAHMGGGHITLERPNYGALTPKALAALISRITRRGPKLSPEIAQGRNLQLTAEEAIAYQARVLPAGTRRASMGADRTYYYVGNWGGRLRGSTNSALPHGAAKKSDVVYDLMHGSAEEALPSLTRFLEVHKVRPERIAELTSRARANMVKELGGVGNIGESEWSRIQHRQYLEIAKELRLKKQYFESLNVPGQRRAKSLDPSRNGYDRETAISPYNAADLKTLDALNEANGTAFMGSYRNYEIGMIDGKPTVLAHMMPGFALGGPIVKAKRNYGLVMGQMGIPMFRGSYKSPLMIHPEQQALMERQQAERWAKLPKDKNGDVWHTPAELDAMRKGKMVMGSRPMPKSFYQDLTNDDPLHGTLQIGRYQPPLHVRNQYVGEQIRYSSATNWRGREGMAAPAFASGTLETRARTALYRYMQGDYSAISDPAVQAYLSAIRTKFTGTLHRGVKDVGSLPPTIRELIRQGRWSDLVGKEFIMRRSSWSTNADTAEGFGQLQLVASVKNRNAVPASEIFPDLTFQSPKGPVPVNESEVYMGGKFRIVAAGKDRLKLEAVYDAARENGGPVNAGRPYLVGEKGPEVFVPRNSGGIIPSYALGGMIRRGKNSYGRKGNPAARAAQEAAKRARAAAYIPAQTDAPEFREGPMSVGRTTIVGNGGVRTNVYAPQGSLPYMPALRLPFQAFNNNLTAAFSSIGANLKSVGASLKLASTKLIANVKTIPGQIKSSFTPMANSIKNIGNQIVVATKAAGNSIRAAGSYVNGWIRPQMYGTVAPGVSGTGPASTFAANLRYSTGNMLHPITYIQNKMAGGAVREQPKPIMGPDGKPMIDKATGQPYMTQPGRPAPRFTGTGMVTQAGASLGGYALGSKVGGSTGGIIGSIAAPLAVQSIFKAGNAIKAAGGIGAALGGGGIASGAAALAGLALPLAVVATAVVVGIKLWKDHKESMRLNALGYGMTAEAAAKAGLKFKDYNLSLKETVERAKNIRQAQQLMFQSMTGSGTPLNISISEFKKLKKTVKEQFADQIKLINKTSADDQIDLAMRLKTQFISMGMTAEEATKKIYTMYTLSNFAQDATLYTVQSEGFNKIKTAIDAAVDSLRIYNDAVKNKLDPTEQANAFNTAQMGITAAVEEDQKIALKNRKADKSKPSFVSSGEEKQIMWDAELAAIEKINSKQDAQTTITQETINELRAANSVIGEMIDLQDTNVSIWQKERLVVRGYAQDLLGLNAQQVNALYLLQMAATKSIEVIGRQTFLKTQYKELDRLKGLQEKYTKALKGQSVAQQISDRDRLSSLQKQVDANNKLAAARIKALDAAKQENDIGIQIAKKQAEYNAAIATGNDAAAQQASLDIQGLQSDLQYNAQVKAIQDATDFKNAPLLRQIEIIQNKQKNLSDAAALAGEKLGDVSTAIGKQESAIGTLITAMANYRTALQQNKDQLAAWKDTPEAKGMLAAITSAAQALKVDLSPYPVDPKTGKPGVDAGKGLYDSISSGLEASLIKSGIIVNGDVYVNGKKVASFGGALKQADSSQVAGGTSGSGSSKKYYNAAGEEVTKKVYDDLPQRSDNGRSGSGYKDFIIPNQTLANKLFANFGDVNEAFRKAFDNKTKVVIQGNTYGIDGQVWMGTDTTKEVLGYWLNSTASKKVKTFKQGGPIYGAGTATSDSIPALLSNGEYVVRASAVKQYGVEHFDALNAQRFSTGGLAAAIRKDPTLRGLTSPLGTRERMIDTATAQLGIGEEKVVDGEGNNVTKYSRWINELKNLGSNVVTWCGTFIQWAAAMSDVKIPDTFHTAGGARNFAGLQQLVNAAMDLPTAKDKFSYSTPDPKMADFKISRSRNNENEDGKFIGSQKNIKAYEAAYAKWEKEIKLPEDLARDRRLEKTSDIGWANVLKNPPMPGDILYLNWAMNPKNEYDPAIPNRIRHAALVTKISGMKDINGVPGYWIDSIDGNMGDSVQRNNYELTRANMRYNPLVAYARPSYKPSKAGMLADIFSNLFNTNENDTYTVKRDKTLPQIAKTLKISYEDLAKLNPEYLRGNIVYAGTEINIPKAKTPVKRAGGGAVFGAGTATSDSIPALLSNGEYVIKAASVSKYGIGTFDALNTQRFAQGGPVRPNILSNEVGTTARSTGAPMGGPFGVLGRGVQDLGSLAYEMLQSTVNSGKFLGGMALNKPNWMSPEDEKMYRKAMLDAQTGNASGALGRVAGRTAMSLFNVYPKVIPWNKIWAQAGLKDLPGQTEWFLANLPSAMPDIYNHYFGDKARKYSEGGVVSKIKEALKKRSNNEAAVPKVVGGKSDTYNIDTDVVGKFTDSERQVSEFMHAWIGLLNTYYGAKYENLFRKNKKASLLSNPITTDLQVAGPRDFYAMGNHPGVGIAFSGDDVQDKHGGQVFMMPAGLNAYAKNLLMPTLTGLRAPVPVAPTDLKITDPDKFNYKEYSDRMNKNILTNDDAKMDILGILTHEFGHQIQSRFMESGVLGHANTASKIFKDKNGKPLKKGDGYEMNADMLSGAMISEMYNAGYMKNIVKAESITKYLKKEYLKYAAPKVGATDITPGDDPHARDSMYRFRAYIEGFKDKNTDRALSDYFGVSPQDLLGDPKKAKSVVDTLSNYKLKSEYFDENAQTRMPDLLNTKYAEILGLGVSGRVTVPHKALNIQTPRDFARALISAYGGTPTEPLIQGIQAWAMQEGGHWQNRALHNPLNTTLKLPGSTKMNTVNAGTGTGVQAYTSWEQGLDATMQTLSFPNHGYEDIIKAFRDSKAKDAGGLFKAINKSDWGHPKYNFDVNSKWTQAMMRYNPAKVFGKDTKNPEWYSELPGGGLITIEVTPDENCEGPNCRKPGCVGLDCPSNTPPGKTIPGDKPDDNPWDPDIDWHQWWPEEEKYYSPKQRTLDYYQHVYPQRPMKKFTGTLKDAANSIPREKTKMGVSIASPSSVYDIFEWGGKKWAKNKMGAGELFEAQDYPNVDWSLGTQVIDGKIMNVIDRPYGEPFYYHPTGGIGTSNRNPKWPGTNIPSVATMYHNMMEKFFLTANGETGFESGFLTRSDVKRWKTWKEKDHSDSLLAKFANGGLVSNLNIPKFESGINMVPANMLAMLHKNEAVIPANMNPFNPNANNATMGGATYNITNNINGYDGDLNQLSNIITQRTMTAIKTLDSTNAKMVGTNKTVGIR